MAQLPTVIRRSLRRSNMWLKHELVVKPQYFILCTAPTNIANTNSTENTLSLFDGFDMQSTAMDTTGLGLFVIGTTVFAWCKIQELSSQHHLITRGCFRFTRNPQAISCLVTLVGASLLSHNPYIMLAMPPIGWSILNFYTIPIEEKQLLEKYGKEYQVYMRKTPRWIRLTANNKTDSE